jgi:YXWGXW repeat-containing protein
MKSSWVLGLLLGIVFAVPASAQVGVYIGSAPPPLRFEARGAMPGPGYAWVDGYWAPHGRHYAWVSGRWDHPPYEGAYWNHPHYDHYRQGWQLHEGHWDHEDHNNHDRGHEHEHR